MSHTGPLAETIRVLVVDDEPTVRDLTEEMLGQLADDLDVDVVDSTAEALTRIDEHDVDCVVSDYEMEPTDGLEFLTQVRETHPDLPFILFTGRGSESVASDAISAGVTDYVQKRGGIDQFELLVNRIEDAVESVRSKVSYREVFEKADVGLTIRDTETGELLDANERYCELLGYDHDELFDLDFEDLTADVDGYGPERAKAQLERVKSEGSHTFLWPDETKAGDVTWVEISLSLAKIEGSERIFASVRDVTDHKRRGEELAAAQRRYEALFNSPLAFTGILAVDGTLLDVNDAALAFADDAREDLVGTPFPETPWWTHSRSLQDDFRSWIEDAAAGNHVRFEADHVSPHGETVTISGIIYPIFEDGEVESLLISGMDISERLDRERRIAALHRASREFSAATDRGTVADVAVEIVSSVLGHDATVVRYVDDGDELVPVSHTETLLETAGERPPYPVGGSLAGRAYRTGEAVVYEDVRTVREPFEHGDLRSVMYLPIGDHGTLSVGDTTVDAFGPSDVDLVGTVAESAAAALDRLERERTISRQRARLDALTESVSREN